MLNLDESVIRHVESGFHIPPKPEILNTIQDIARDKDGSISDVGDCLAADVGLSSAVLKTLNSPFYGMSRSISDVRQATMMLGIESIKALVASYEIRRAFQGESCISLERFWDSAAEIANAMVFVGKRVNSNIPLENLHVTGLFHDCGLPAMSIKFSDYVTTLREANEHPDIILTELEEKRYRCNHAVVGYYIASSWGLPKSLCQVILQHHDLEALERKVEPEFLWMYACLKAAENLVETTRRFKPTTDWDKIGPQVLSAMGLTDLDYSDLEEDYNNLSLE